MKTSINLLVALILMLAIGSDAQTTGLRGTGEYVGFSAQEVQKVLPEAVSRSANGYLQLNSDPILWTMLNAIKEQQEQISSQQSAISSQQNQTDQQRKLIETQQRQIDSMKKFICLANKDADFCKE